MPGPGQASISLDVLGKKAEVRLMPIKDVQVKMKRPICHESVPWPASQANTLWIVCPLSPATRSCPSSTTPTDCIRPSASRASLVGHLQTGTIVTGESPLLATPQCVYQIRGNHPPPPVLTSSGLIDMERGYRRIRNRLPHFDLVMIETPGEPRPVPGRARRLLESAASATDRQRKVPMGQPAN